MVFLKRTFNRRLVGSFVPAYDYAFMVYAFGLFQCSALLDKSSNRDDYIEDIKEEYEDVRADHYDNVRDRKYLSLADARQNKFSIDWANYTGVGKRVSWCSSSNEYPI